MFNALVLVRNLESSAKRLDFGEFTISAVGLRFKELRGVFSSVDVNQDDWIFEKSYVELPLGPPGSPVGGIPNDIEDILLLFRLYRAGDIAFIKQATIPPNGNTVVQFPYRAMNDLNSYSLLRFGFKSMNANHGKPSLKASEKASPGLLIGSRSETVLPVRRGQTVQSRMGRGRPHPGLCDCT